MLAADAITKSVPYVVKRAQRVQTVWFTFFLTFTGWILLRLMFGEKGADPSALAWTVFLVGIAAAFFRPRYGVYALLFLTLVGDSSMLEWYPFFKNFSSIESLLYVNDQVIISPLEAYIALTYLSWLVRSIWTRRLNLQTGALFFPALLFGAFMVFGMVYGIRRGGSVTIGLWEVRPILYLPALVILVSNVLEKREHIRTLMWWIMTALFIEGLVGCYTFFIVLGMDLGKLEAITEHSAAIHMNTLFILAASGWLFTTSRFHRLAHLAMIPPVFITYLVTQRRASYVALIIALVFMAIILYKENQKVFWALVPATAFFGLAYIGVFWNTTGPLGMPAQAVKSVIAQDQADLKDQRSNLYREIENVNTEFTIRQMPLTGVGFGNKFFILVPLPDISFFEWWEYITHNSVLWIWMKTGVGGFFSMIFLIGTAVMLGVRVVWRMPGGELSAIALTMLLYVIMHFIYAYVDMSWEAQSMVYVGTAMGILNCMEHIVAKPIPTGFKRWPWSPEPIAAPEILPLPEGIK